MPQKLILFFFFLFLFVCKWGLKCVNGFHLDLGDAQTNGPLIAFFLFCNCHHPSSGEWFGMTLASQSYLWIVSMRKGQKKKQPKHDQKKEKKSTGNCFHVFAYNRRWNVLWEFHLSHCSATNHDQKWKTVKCCNKKFVTKEISFLAVFWTLCVSRLHLFFYFLFLFGLIPSISPHLSHISTEELVFIGQS